MKEYRMKATTKNGKKFEVVVVTGIKCPFHNVRIYPDAGWTNTSWAPTWYQGYDRVPEHCSDDILAAAKAAVKKALGARKGARHWRAYLRAHAA